MKRTRIKLCGLRREEDVAALYGLDVDAAGFILVPGRKRTVTPERVRQLQSLLPAGVRSVGVMMDPSVQEVESLLETVPLDEIQLHGGESPSFCRRIKEQLDITVVKVFHMEESVDGNAVPEAYAPWIGGALLDSSVGGVRGGSGKRFAWDQIPAIRERWKPLGVPLWVAGGVSADNVTALLSYHPDGVDVSSRIETAGRKDPVLMKRLVERVRQVDQSFSSTRKSG
ncbi:phosphoribosylanthranilate isomerase [Desmospora profundinema]|uniref:N-(5'-phosphoribosyl)anthranilate isomerase n=1 Tax=Desmospora profundinema TaxID=1571184 RepID=A0ABU1II97_9BACL|nr:phosphoribosylanthranilate isomerase [Desmospora profundinema]MDR6224495.1 phosphoribosylanthranilate isomerase [Desmospora profundinema]